MTGTNDKPISKTRLLASMKELDWRAVKAAVEANPECSGGPGAARRRRGPNFRDRFGKTALHYRLKKRSNPDHMRMVLAHVWT
jgi:hypothetical protein